MKDCYEFEYLDEAKFKKCERALKKYNMLAYKKLVFEYYQELKDGEELGKLVKESKKNKFNEYELTLPTDKIFAKIHGIMTIHYKTYKEKKKIVFTKITPEEILLEDNNTELSTYKGIIVSKDNNDKDKFKIDLLNMLNK